MDEFLFRVVMSNHSEVVQGLDVCNRYQIFIVTVTTTQEHMRMEGMRGG